MSRSGTLQDALRYVDQFQRAAPPPEKALLGDVKESGRREKSAKDGRRKSPKEDKERRRRRKEVKKRGGDDGEDSGEDVDDATEKRRAEREKKAGRESRRKERKGSSRRLERKSEKKRTRRRDEKKRQSKRLRSPQDDSSVSEDEDSLFGSKSSASEDGDSPVRAKQIAAGILEEFPEVRHDLQQLLQMVDDGQAVDITGLANKRLITLLHRFFQSLHLNKSQAGVYLLPARSQPTLERLGWSLYSGPQSKDGKKPLNSQEHGPELPPSPFLGRCAPEADHKSHTKEMETCVASSEFKTPGNMDANIRRVIGPAMPSVEMLEAAAKLMEAEEALRHAEEALEDDPMIGPPPPAAVAEASTANDAERFEEVTRMTASDIGDAYDLLGLKRGVTAGVLKKRYWKLSLLVHPDKCSHPLAQQAFMALNKAVKDLQDPIKRSEIDRKADEKMEKEEYEAEMRAQREAAQWRKLRGEEALPGDAALLQGNVKEQARDEWMTVLPPERQAGGPPSQQNTFFSRSEKRSRGDTSAWTDTPLEKAQKAKMQYLEAYKQATLTGPENIESSFEKEKATKTAALMDQYNEKKRSRSLVEDHQQKSVKEQKKIKREKGHREEKQKDWVEAHPWKPWDREKDLAAGRQKVKPSDENSMREELSSRFGSNPGQRNFL